MDNDGSGRLSGYAWGENIGWINFSPTFGGGVCINRKGILRGYAWGENIGWINFSSNFSVRAGWPESGPKFCKCDVNNDGRVDLADYAIFLSESIFLISLK